MTSSEHESFMALAIKQAKQAKADGELPFGAVIVLNGQVVTVGRCRESKLKTVLAHAETEAVDSACKELNTNNLSECVIYCTCEPCPMCAAAIFQAKIKHVVVGASRRDMSFMRPRSIDLQALADDSGYDVTITRGVSKPEILGLFDGSH